MRTIAVIEGCAITELNDGSVRYTAPAMIDGDGTGSSHGDPDYQRFTSLKRNGVSLNADEDRYIVVPPAVIFGVPGVVLGCRALVSFNGLSTDAVVGDVGPHSKIGEISIATAKALGIPSSPVDGGIDEHAVHYTIWPGVAADGYELQPA